MFYLSGKKMRKEEDFDWSEATTWQDRVKFLFETKQTRSEEFQTYLRIYGKERLEKIWKDYIDEKQKIK